MKKEREPSPLTKDKRITGPISKLELKDEFNNTGFLDFFIGAQPGGPTHLILGDLTSRPGDLDSRRRSIALEGRVVLQNTPQEVIEKFRAALDEIERQLTVSPATKHKPHGVIRK